MVLLQPPSSPPVFPLPTTAQSSDDHEQSRETDANAPEAKLANPMILTQIELGAACKRINVACGGSKAELMRRLAGKGYVSLAWISHLCTLYEEHGRENVVRSRGQPAPREPNWTEGETLRLIYVVADPKHAVDIYYLYNKPEDRSGVDVRREDPFAMAFRLQFNDISFEPDAPAPALGITEDVLSDMAESACDRPYDRNGTVLKARWLRLRTIFTEAWRKYTASGQKNGDSFENYVGPDKQSPEARAEMYCAAAFHGQPSFGQVVKIIPPRCAAEEGITRSSGFGERNNGEEES
jgi:hypothetical protein